jgi:hypothetical protein
VIQLEHLRIEEFRGIREIDIPLGSKSFVVHGPNGSGKSGVVDAIDFALTGNIGRLAGSGTGGVTLAKHGPHVHQRDNPAAAVVKLTVKDIDTGATATLKRNIKNPTQFTLDPDTAQMRTAIAQAQAHPELTLSRREIIKYVVSKPADRAQGVQALLKLERLDLFRKLLKSSLTKISSELTTAESELNSADRSFTGHLDITSLLTAEIAREINERRETLGLESLSEITIDSDFLAGITPATATRSLNLATALREVGELNQKLTSFESIDEKRIAVSNILEELDRDPDLLDALKHRALIEQGLASINSSSCPLCDKEWDDANLLRDHLRAKVERSEAARALSQRITTAGDEYKIEVEILRGQVEGVISISESYGDDELPHLLRNWSGSLLIHVQSLGSLDALVAARSSLSVRQYEPPEGTRARLASLGIVLLAGPDQSATEDARTFLTVAKDRWARVRLARTTQAKAKAVNKTARSIYDKYCAVVDDHLTSLYQTVEADFSSFYQKINSDDEGAFRAELLPAAGSLDLSVNFYGLGMFPPTAYHSEGHQDGMGICLFLALVKQILGSDFRFAVLDDVVMSIDVNHRRQFCELLKTEFPDVQFVITTHDEVWARQMQSAGLITSKAQARFFGWTVNGGPAYEQRDIWERIEVDVARNDIAGAAHKLRRWLEAASADIAENVGARVAYRGDANYDLSNLLDAVKGRHVQLLKRAADSANSWKDTEASQVVTGLKVARTSVISDEEGEIWILNALVHNNDWTRASAADFQPILDATRAFLNLFKCTNTDCGSWVHVAGMREECLRCACGTYNLNLLKKP